MDTVKLKSLLAATVFAVASGSTAFAATFDFSFSNVDGDIAGTVTGQITLADGDGTFAADSVFVNSAPNTLGYDPLGFDFTDLTVLNSFTVVGGVITDADFLGIFTPETSTNTALALSNSIFTGSTFLTAFQGGVSNVNRINDSADSTLTFQPSVSAVPLPASIPLLFGALGMLGLTARKRRS